MHAPRLRHLALLLLALLVWAPPALIAVSGGQQARAQAVDPPDRCVPRRFCPPDPQPTATTEPTAEPTSVPTAVPPTPTATSTATPRPTSTPKPAVTPRPTATPKATAAPKPAATPKPTAKQKPAAAPKPKPGATPAPGTSSPPKAGVIEAPATGVPAESGILGETVACSAGVAGLSAAAVERQGRGLTFKFARALASAVDVDVFQASSGRRVVGNRLIVRFAARTEPFAWDGRRPSGRRLGSGTYYVRFRAAYDTPAGRRVDERRMTVERSRGRFTVRPSFSRLETCETLQSFGLDRPVFGGTSSRPLAIVYRLNQPGRVGVTVTRGKRKVVRRFATRTVPAGRAVTLRLSARGLPRGTYRVRLTVTRGKHVVKSVLTAGRL